MVLGSLGKMNVLITATDRATPKMAAVQSKMGGMAGVATTAATAIAGIGVAAGAAGGASVIAFSNLEDQMVEVQKVTGMTDSELGKLQNRLMAMSSGPMPASSKELAEIAAQAGSVGVRGTENIARFTESVQKMAIATRLSSSEAAEQIARISNAFEIPTSKAEQLGSTINALSNTTSAWSDEVSQALRRVAPAANTMGVSMQEAAGSVATLISKGVPARRAGTKMRRVFQMMATETDKMAEVVGVSADKMREKVQEDAMGALQEFITAAKETGNVGKVVTDTFGAIGASAVANLTDLDQLNKNIDTANKAFKNGTSLQDEYTNAIDRTSAKFENLKNVVVNTAIDIGEELAPSVNQLLDGLANGIPKVAKFGSELTNALGSGNFGQVERMLAGLGKQVVTGLTQNLNQATSMLNSTNFAKLSNNVITGIYNAIVRQFNGGGGKALQGLGSAFLNFLGAAFDSVLGASMGTMKALSGIMNDLVGQMQQFLRSGNAEKLGTTIMNTVLDALAHMTTALTSGKGRNGMKKSAITLMGEFAWNLLKFSGHLMLTVGTIGWSMIETLLSKAVQGWGQMYGMVWDAITGTFNDLIDEAASWGQDLISEFIDGIVNHAKGNIDRVEGAVENISGYFGGSPPHKGPLEDAWKKGPKDFADAYEGNLEKAMKNRPLSLRVNDSGTAETGQKQKVVIEKIEVNEVNNAREISRQLQREMQRAGVT